MREFLNLQGVYEHHGIDCGDGTVIHYRKTPDDAVISRTSIASFATGQPIYVKRYSVCYIPDVVVQRAESRLGERRYNLFTNNCEHFANWCKTGASECAQLANFGLGAISVSPYDSRRLIEEAAHAVKPVESLELFRQALGNVAIAQSTIQPQYQQAQTEADTWHRVAQLALKQGREDLARAALERKVNYKKTATNLKSQLDQLALLQENLKHKSPGVQQRVSVERFY
jgi:hypothetical protein